MRPARQGLSMQSARIEAARSGSENICDLRANSCVGMRPGSRIPEGDGKDG